jgi:hypothetical protein
MPASAQEQTIADRLAWFMESWRSIEVKERRETTIPARGTTTTYEHSYAETTEGQRRYDLSFEEPGDGRTVRSSRYSDGQRFADETAVDGRAQVVIKPSFADESQIGQSRRGETLTNLYVGGEPLHKLLADATSLGSDRHLGRECDQFLLAGVKWSRDTADVVYCLDRQTGWPLELRHYRNETDRQADRPRWTWTVESFERVEGERYWPMRSLSVMNRVTDDGESTPLATSEIRVEEVRFDRPLPASLFWPSAEPGTTVWDKVEKKQWVVPGEKEPPKPVTPQTVASPALPPTDWTATASKVGLLAGLAIIAASIVLWWRRR